MIASTHDVLGLLLDFHWREALRPDWRSDQITIIARCIHSTLHTLGIHSSETKGGRGESPEPFAGTQGEQPGQLKKADEEFTGLLGG